MSKPISQVHFVIVAAVLSCACGQQSSTIEEEKSEFLYETMSDGTEFSAWVSDVEPGEPIYFYIDLDFGAASYRINESGAWKQMRLTTEEDEDGPYTMFEAMEQLPHGTYSVAFRHASEGGDPSEYCCVQFAVP